MEYEAVLYEKKGGVAYVTLNRPEKLNVMNDALVRDHKAALLEADADPEVHVAVVRGAGRAFCAGHDISPQSRPAVEKTKIIDGIRRMQKRMADCRIAIEISIPVIGQIHGYCLAGANDMMMYYDINIAAENTVMGHPPVRIMGTPDNPRWTYLLGPQRASMMVLTGRQIDGKKAAEWGWVCEAVPAEQLAERVEEIANDMAKIPRDILMLNKKLVTDWFWASGGASMMHNTAFVAGMAGRVSNETPEGAEFWAKRQGEGVKAAVEYRDTPFGDYRGANRK